MTNAAKGNTNEFHSFLFWSEHWARVEWWNYHMRCHWNEITWKLRKLKFVIFSTKKWSFNKFNSLRFDSIKTFLSFRLAKSFWTFFICVENLHENLLFSNSDDNNLQKPFKCLATSKKTHTHTQTDEYNWNDFEKRSKWSREREKERAKGKKKRLSKHTNSIYLSQIYVSSSLALSSPPHFLSVE